MKGAGKGCDVTSESNKVSARVYPWHDLAWDLALGDGMDPAIIESRFVANKLEGMGDCDRHWQEAASIQDDINTDISTHLWREILEGKVPVRKANGNPLKGESKQFKMRGPDTPHLTVAEGNEWLTKNRYLQVWVPGDLKNRIQTDGECASRFDSAPLNYHLLATPAALLDAFQRWGLKPAWFADLNGHKWLLGARLQKGQGQRGHVVEPLFCPFAVMNGLVDKVRKASRLQPETAWRTLAHKFPKVYAEHASYDPRQRSGD